MWYMSQRKWHLWDVDGDAGSAYSRDKSLKADWVNYLDDSTALA